MNGRDSKDAESGSKLRRRETPAHRRLRRRRGNRWVSPDSSCWWWVSGCIGGWQPARR